MSRGTQVSINFTTPQRAKVLVKFYRVILWISHSASQPDCSQQPTNNWSRETIAKPKKRRKKKKWMRDMTNKIASSILKPQNRLVNENLFSVIAGWVWVRFACAWLSALAIVVDTEHFSHEIILFFYSGLFHIHCCHSLAPFTIRIRSRRNSWSE